MRALVPFSWSQDPTRRGGDDPFQTLQQEVNRIFDGLGRFGLAPDLTPNLPRLDVSETADSFDIHAELPGLTDNDIQLTLSGDILTLKGEKQLNREEKGRDFHIVERRTGTFSRTLRLPFLAEPDAAKARFDKGILTISVRKPKEVAEKSQRIPISG